LIHINQVSSVMLRICGLRQRRKRREHHQHHRTTIERRARLDPENHIVTDIRDDSRWPRERRLIPSV
jgi:hypothetical protein